MLDVYLSDYCNKRVSVHPRRLHHSRDPKTRRRKNALHYLRVLVNAITMQINNLKFEKQNYIKKEKSKIYI